MDDNKKLIEEAAKAIYNDDPDWGYVYEDEHGEYAASWDYLGGDLHEKFRSLAEGAFAVFEKAHAPTDIALQLTVRAEPIGDGKESLETDIDIPEPGTKEWAAGLLRQIADDLVSVENRGEHHV